MRRVISVWLSSYREKVLCMRTERTSLLKILSKTVAKNKGVPVKMVSVSHRRTQMIILRRNIHMPSHLQITDNISSSKALCSIRAQAASLMSTPEEYPPIEPSVSMTRWQGKIIGIGFLPRALPTALKALGFPITSASHL